MGRGRLRAAAALTAAVFVLAATANGSPPSATPAAKAGDSSACAIDDADRMAIAPLEEFERRHGISEARRALAAARQSRERLEAARVPDPFAVARREELAFLNHLILAFDAYLAHPEAAGGLGALEGIVARGRRHREQSREALRKEARRTRAGTRGS
ncbi:MAG: hypothetical protein M3167_13060 [Acidobacteriota bacterium]|nr:hypothetical protein [Acidobacteriota bacterium]